MQMRKVNAKSTKHAHTNTLIWREELHHRDTSVAGREECVLWSEVCLLYLHARVYAVRLRECAAD